MAGAIAQAQRLQAETNVPAAKARAGDIEATLKRLTRLAERLMQLARAEGGRLRQDVAADLRPVAKLIIDDLSHSSVPGRIVTSLPDSAVMSNVDPDVFAIPCRNLIDNALRHGATDGAVSVTLDADGTLSVANDGPILPPKVLSRLTTRFDRGEAGGEGSGLGLAIVAAIAERNGGKLTLRSPSAGCIAGFEARMRFPSVAPGIVD